ncbi:MAG: hypothetical protein R3C69_02655 [Geminicoccaceae bacterium]
MAGQHRGQLALDRLERGVGVGAAEIEEEGRHPAQVPAAALEGGDGVGEVGCRRVAGDGLDLGPVPGQRLRESGAEVIGRETAVGRQAEGCRPGGEQLRFVGHGSGSRGLWPERA